MSLRLLIVLFFSVFAIGVAAYFFTMDTPDQLQQMEEETEDSETEAEMSADTTTGTGSIEDLLALNAALVCEFTSYTETTGSSVAGILYVSDGRVRGDFESEQAGVTYESHIILKDEAIYTWTTNPPSSTGSMFAVNESGAGHPSIAQTFDYTCSEWEREEAKFSVPDDITFRDRTETTSVAQ